MVATIDEILAFRQHCSGLLDDREVGRGLDAARDVSTSIHEVVESYDRSLWHRGLTAENQADVKAQLKRRVIDDVLAQGRIPVELPIVTEIGIENGWGLVHIRATVRARLV